MYQNLKDRQKKTSLPRLCPECPFTQIPSRAVISPPKKYVDSSNKSMKVKESDENPALIFTPLRLAVPRQSAKPPQPLLSAWVYIPLCAHVVQRTLGSPESLSQSKQGHIEFFAFSTPILSQVYTRVSQMPPGTDTIKKWIVKQIGEPSSLLLSPTWKIHAKI